MLRHETIFGLLDLSQMRGVKPACAKFALKGVPKEKQSWAIMPGDGREPTAGLPMLAPRFYRERSLAGEAIPFKSVVNDNSIEQGSA